MTAPSIAHHGSTEGSSARWAPWLLGLVGAVLALGPALGPGSILRLDFIALPDLPVPRGVWGLGPELPRRLPLMLPLAWASPVTGGALGIKLVLVAGMASACAGAARLARPAPLLARLGAGVVYGLGPFALTRVGVGHIFVVAAMGILPWAVPTLLEPHRRVRATLLWGAALGFTGFFGGFLAGVLVGVGLLRARGARAPAVVAALLVGQLPWLVPGLVVIRQGQGYAGAEGFATDLDGWDGTVRVLAGHGFWASPYQVGIDEGPWVGLIGLALLGLALVGRRRLDPRWGPGLTVVGVGAVVITVLAGWSPTAGPVGTLIDVAAPVARETQRLLVLYLLWLAPAAALGAASLAERRPPGPGREVLGAVPLAAGLVLAAPGMWGIGGDLQPIELPAEWAAMRSAVEAEPGTVLTYPWAQYLDLLAADGERVLNPVPIYLGTDVLATSRLGLEPGDRERNDSREAVAASIAPDLLAGEDVAPRLADLGVRWVVLLHEVDREWEFYQVALEDDTSLEPVIEGRTLSLYRVPGWEGPVVTDDGTVLDPDGIVAPLQRLAGSEAATWFRPAAPGWRRGWSATAATDQGLLRLPAGSGPVWYWPALVCLAADAVTLAAVGWAAIGLRRGRPAGGGPAPPAPPDGSSDLPLVEGSLRIRKGS